MPRIEWDGRFLWKPYVLQQNDGMLLLLLYFIVVPQEVSRYSCCFLAACVWIIESLLFNCIGHHLTYISMIRRTSTHTDHFKHTQAHELYRLLYICLSSPRDVNLTWITGLYLYYYADIYNYRLLFFLCVPIFWLDFTPYSIILESGLIIKKKNTFW